MNHFFAGGNEDRMISIFVFCGIGFSFVFGIDFLIYWEVRQ